MSDGNDHDYIISPPQAEDENPEDAIPRRRGRAIIEPTEPTEDENSQNSVVVETYPRRSRRLIEFLMRNENSDDSESSSGSDILPNQDDGLAEIAERNAETAEEVIIPEATASNDDLPEEPPPNNLELDAEEARTSNDNNIINLTSPSPPKKRKRLSHGSSSHSNTPKVKIGNADDDEDDGLTCPICLDTWEMSGEHRLVALRCGHLFGDGCIRRWLNESARQTGVKSCPQCKSKASNKDIRCLYAKRLRAIDRSEEHRLRDQLDDEKRRTQTLQTELATIKMSYALVNNKNNSLEADNNRLRQIVRSGGCSGAFTSGLDGTTDAKIVQRLASYKMHLDRNVEITREPGCRVMVYASNQSALIASQKSAQSLFPGYGLRFIDTPTLRPLNFLHASGKLLRDISLNANQQLLAVTSMETRSKLFDLRTRLVTSVFNPAEKPLWSCAMDRNEREYFLYLGAQHGSTFVYDVRFTETVVSEFRIDDDLSPVINVAPVPTGKLFPSGGFLVCKLLSLWFYEYSSGTATPTRLNIDGPFISLHFDVAQETILLSARSNQRVANSRYILAKLDKIDDMPMLDIKVIFYGSKTTPVMTRPAQIAVESNTLVAGYLQDAKQLTLFDARRAQRVQTIPAEEIVYDSCPVYTANNTYLAALTENKCRMYKIISTPATLSS